MPSCGGESCSGEPWLLELSQPDAALHVWEGQEFAYQSTYNGMTCCCAGPLMFSAEGLPTGLEIDPASGLIRGRVDYNFTNLASPEVEVTATVTLQQQDMCSGTIHQVNVPFVFIVHNTNRLATLDFFVLVNLTDPSRVNAPRTKDLLRAEVFGITDPDGDPVSVQIEWQVNGTTVATTQGAVSWFDLSQPGQGDLGDQISAVVQLDDGAGWTQVASISVVVDNSAPVIESIDVTGYHALENDVYYFVEGQEVEIRIRVQDDDWEQDRNGEMVSVELDGELPPGLNLPGGVAYIDENGEVIIRGEIERHSGTESTQYYQPRFRARDQFGSGEQSSCFLAATNFEVSSISMGASTDPNKRTSVAGSTRDNVRRLGITLTGVGSPPGGKEIVWYVKDLKTWKYLASRVYAKVPPGMGANGAWTLELPFWVFVNERGNIEGLEKEVGREADLVVEIYTYPPVPLVSQFLGKSTTFYITASPE